MPGKISLLLLLLLSGLACNKTPSESPPPKSTVKKAVKDEGEAPDHKVDNKESPKKLDPVQLKFKTALFQGKLSLSEGQTNFAKAMKAEREGKEADRKKYSRYAKTSFTQVIEKLDRMRVKPYVDNDEQWLEPYMEMEKIEAAAGMGLHDIAKHAHMGDDLPD